MRLDSELLALESELDSAQRRQVSVFIGHLSRASSDATLAERFFDGVTEFVPSAAAGLTLVHPSTQAIECAFARGVSEFFLSRYEELGRHQDPVLAQAMAVGRAVDNGDLMTLDAWRAHPVYTQVFHLHRLVHVMRAPLLFDGALHGSVVFGRTERDGGFNAPERSAIDAIARLAGVAIATLRMRRVVRRERDQAVAALDLCGDATIMTDHDTATRHVSGAARKLLGRLGEHEQQVDALLRRLSPPAGASPGAEQEAAVTLTDGRTARLRGRTSPAGLHASATVVFLELLEDRDELVGSLPAFGLTPREREVAELAAAGLRDGEIAAQLYLSPYTVKQYLKGVYSKLGVRSRVDLARMAAHSSPTPARGSLRP